MGPLTTTHIDSLNSSSKMFAMLVLRFRSSCDKQIIDQSSEFVLNSVIRKMLPAKSNDVVNDCSSYFNYVVSDAIYRRKIRLVRFLVKLLNSMKLEL